MTRAHGVDLSYYDISFDPIKATKPIDFVIQRVALGFQTGGIRKDSALDILYPGVKKVGIRGAYYYLSSHSSWQKQADFFLKVVEDYDYQFYALDFEGKYNTMGLEFVLQARYWMEYVQKAVGTKPVLLYTSPTHYDADLYPYGDWMRDYPLWIAQYWDVPNPDFNPGMPNHRKDWKIYQYASEINFPGHAKEYGTPVNSIDLNVFNGTVADMRSWLNLPPDTAPIPPVPPVTTLPVVTERYKVLADALNVRESPSIYGNLVSALHGGDVIEVVPITLVTLGGDDEIWLHHAKGWSCVSKSGRSPYMEKLSG